MKLGYETLEETLPNVDYFVEADGFTLTALRRMYHSHPDDGVEPVPWKEVSDGFWQIVPGGTNVSFLFAYIYDNKLVCFYFPTSQKIDFDHVERFLQPYWQSKKKGGLRRRCNPGNFCHCLLYCKPKV